MNAVEIEAAVSELAAQPFNQAEFPFAFLAAFGNKKTTILTASRTFCFSNIAMPLTVRLVQAAFVLLLDLRPTPCLSRATRQHAPHSK